MSKDIYYICVHKNHNYWPYKIMDAFVYNGTMGSIRDSRQEWADKLSIDYFNTSSLSRTVILADIKAHS